MKRRFMAPLAILIMVPTAAAVWSLVRPTRGDGTLSAAAQSVSDADVYSWHRPSDLVTFSGPYGRNGPASFEVSCKSYFASAAHPAGIKAGVSNHRGGIATLVCTDEKLKPAVYDASSYDKENQWLAVMGKAIPDCERTLTGFKSYCDSLKEVPTKTTVDNLHAVIGKLQNNVKSLSDLNDALTKRLETVEKRLDERGPSK